MAVVFEAVGLALAEVDPVVWEAPPVGVEVEAAPAGQEAVGAATDPLMVLGRTRKNQVVSVVSSGSVATN